MKEILVLLSTYNGEKYLAELLDSVLLQKDVDVSILIRDDGSKDSTVSIIDEYCKYNGKIFLIQGNNCGPANSFCALLEEACRCYDRFDYYCFCDQDDIWEENKLSAALDFLEKKENSDNPSLYMGAYQMVDAGLNRIRTPILHPNISLPGILASNFATGCTMVFNRKLLTIATINSTKDIIMHDYWLSLVCIAIDGNVFYDSTPHILYRQHESNVIGGKTEPFAKRWLVRFKKIFKKGDCYKSKLANALLSSIRLLISEENRQFLEAIISCNRLSSKMRIFRTKDFWKGNIDTNLRNLGLILLNKF